ncbi:hypothetical protein ULVI_03020 [Cochleicola gelatinilyticus]|uniref:Uncharacterized protein n=2 Tax=Cochleicola gelatinilyticus TaxID=1763537 RepID=A0A167IJY6_9FLAO|nr:hypothetical protein ULVI_03020 [Cochleicola gelatinilyticus]
MKHNAKTRGKSFSITLDEFRQLCKETGYIITKGFRGRAASIDRIDNSKGYSIDNIQIMSLRANVKKYHEVDKYADVPF